MSRAIATIKNHMQELRLFNHRLIITLIVIFILSIFLILRLVYLQIYQHGLYTTLSQQNQLNILPIEPKRGLIYDRNGVLLAENKPVFSLEIIPQYVRNLKSTIKNLSKIISLSPDDITAFYKLKKQTRHFQSIPLKINLSNDEVAKFSVNQYQFPGVSIQARLIRYYPLGQAMVQVIGYVARINAKELANADPSNYNASDYIGKVGIEKYYESILHGKTGYEKAEIDASGRILRIRNKIPATAGDNLYLTIDSGLQIAAEKALGSHPGAVVAIQPSTGQVLALVSNPSYDPNDFITGLSSNEFNKLQNAEDRPLYNRAIRGQYPIASTIKPFLGLEGLESNIITPDYVIRDPGFYMLHGSHHIYRDWMPGGHGYVNLTKAIIESCDTFFYNLSNLLGIRRIDYILKQFGFGSHTGIDMSEELPGLVASPKWKQARMGQRWYAGDTLNAGIGQGYMLTTPLQLANATAALAERGHHYKPFLVSSLKQPNGSIITVPSTPLPDIKLHKFTWFVVLNAMRGVVDRKDGTGFRFGRNAPYEVAAKTGTAQVYSLKQNQPNIQQDVPLKLRDHSLFIAFAPFNNPKIAIAVIVEHSKLAPLVAREVLDYYLLQDKHTT